MTRFTRDHFRGFLSIIAVFLATFVLRSVAQQPAERTKSDKEALSRFQEFVGDWKGVALPKRGSAKDAWSEECQWAWSFEGDRAMLSLTCPNGKFLRQATLRNVAGDKFEMAVSTAEGTKRTFSGELNDKGHLVLNSKESAAGSPTRITLRTVASGDRLLILYERHTEGDRFARLAEVGFTRKGSGFGQGTNYVECVVTGGVGTIPVTHKGETFYVCCTGCRDYFNDNAEEVLAEYRARKAEEKKKKNKSS